MHFLKNSAMIIKNYIYGKRCIYLQRCKWCNLNNEIYIKYHDKEWGIPKYDDKSLLELLILEPFQAGLSWETILNKRESFRQTFADYDIDKICSYGEDEILKMLKDASIIRNRRKIEAAINNTKVFRNIQREWESFSEYIWHFTDKRIIYEIGKTCSALSDKVTKDMKKRGMKFVGTTIVYSYLQAIGVIYSHDVDCFMYEKKGKNCI